MTDKEIIEKYYELRSCRAVAECFGISGETVRRTLIENNINRTGWKQTPKYALSKKQYYKYKPVEPVNKKCACCGVEFIAHRKNKIYCSRKCKDVALRRSKGQDSRLEPRQVECVICGAVFKTTNPTKKTCSKTCSDVLKGISKASEIYIQCAICGEIVATRNKSQKTCLNLECKEKYKKVRHAERNKRNSENAKERAKQKRQLYRLAHTIEKECAECGTLFYCLDTENKCTCSSKCSRRYASKKAEKRIPKEQRIDKITLKRLFKRDNGNCYLCGKKCNWDDWNFSKKGNKYPGDEYPVIEHVIPISRGGLNAWDNVRLAHWKCNLEKADKIIMIKPMSKQVAYSQKFNTQATQAKKTAQYTLEGKLIKIWESTAQIRRELGLNDKHIQNVCRKSGTKTGNAYGYHWEYVS